MCLCVFGSIVAGAGWVVFFTGASFVEQAIAVVVFAIAACFGLGRDFSCAWTPFPFFADLFTGLANTEVLGTFGAVVAFALKSVLTFRWFGVLGDSSVSCIAFFGGDTTSTNALLCGIACGGAVCVKFAFCVVAMDDKQGKQDGKTNKTQRYDAIHVRYLRTDDSSNGCFEGDLVQ